MTADADNGLGPVEALRLLRRVLRDPDLPAGQRIAVAAVVLQADRGTRRAWASYRQLARDWHVGPDSIAGALRVEPAKAAGGKAPKPTGKGLARYLRPGRRGPHGSREYIVLAAGSAPESGALASAPESGTQAPASAPESDAQAPASAPESGANLKEKKEQKEKRKRRPKVPPDPRVAEFIDWFCEAYRSACGRGYIVQGSKDGGLVKGLLKRLDAADGDGLTAMKRAAEAMLADSWGKSRASVGLLASQINAWLNPRGRGTTGRAGHGSRHVPATVNPGEYDGLTIDYGASGGNA